MRALLVYLVSPLLSIKAVEYLYSGVRVDGLETLILVTLVLAVWNLLVRPVVRVLSLPVNILTLGLFGIVLNIGVVWFTAELVDGFTTGGLLGAVLCAIAIGLTSSTLREFVG